MQKIWQQTKRIVIFLGLWAIVTGLTSSASFALIEWLADDKQKGMFKNVEKGLNIYLYELNGWTFLITYLITMSFLRKKIASNGLFILSCSAVYLCVLALLFYISTFI
ncbi:MAG: hypothetical protein J6N49_06645 [Alphaproteobacteria bacterium]|nr:hypothetical protein [Alphaproteobacteria bacterium]